MSILTLIVQLLITLALWAFMIALYMLPGLIARSRKHPHAARILVMNFFTGWTVLGWIGCLIWVFVPPPVAPHSSQGPMSSNGASLAEEIARLSALVSDGVLTKDEFEAQKRKLLNA